MDRITHFATVSYAFCKRFPPELVDEIFEHRALVSMIDRSAIPRKVIVLMDRGYESFNNIAHLQEKGWNFVIRAKESYGIISNLPLPDANEFDIDITLTLTRRQTKETLALLADHPERYRWLQPRTTFDYIKPKQSNMYDLHFFELLPVK